MSRIGELPAHRQALQGRTHSAPYCHADYDPIRAYRGGNGPAWRILRAVCVWGFFVALGVALFFNLSK
jgi:hypothetical protein